MTEEKKADRAMKEAEQDQEDHKRNNERRLNEKKQAIEERKKQVKDLQCKLQDVLYEYNGQESNIPVNHGYWDMMNQFKALNKEEDVEFVRQQEARRG